MGEVSTRSRGKFRHLTRKKALFIVAFLILVASIGLYARFVWLKKTSPKVVPVNNQKVDSTAADAALKELQKNPSSVPSGKFEPGKGDYFRSDKSTNKSGVKQ